VNSRPATAAEARAELARRELARRHLADFVTRTSSPDYVLTPNHRDLCRRLQRFVEQSRARKSPRLIVVMPPQRGKSHISTQRATVWAMGAWPGVRIGVAGYSQDIANYHSMRAKQIAESVEARTVFPRLGEAQDDKPVRAFDTPAIDTQDEWTAGGSAFIGVGLGVGLSGRPLDMLFIDDPHKDPADYRSVANRNRNHDWYHGVGRARLAPGGGVCFVSTPWGLDDLMERQKRIAAENPDADQFEVVRFPEIAEEDEFDMDGVPMRRSGEVLNPSRHTLTMALATKATVPAWLWSTHYRCIPTSDAGDVVKREHTLNRHRFDHRAAMSMRWDAVWSSTDPTFGKSATSDLVSLQVWGRIGANRYLLDRIGHRMTGPELRQAYLDLHAKWPNVGAKLLEKTANGQWLYDELHGRLGGMLLVPVPIQVVPAKFQQTAYLWEAGNVYLPDPSIAPWVGEYVEQIVTIPAAAHDDDGAATAHALSWSVEQDTPAIPAAIRPRNLGNMGRLAV